MELHLIRPSVVYIGLGDTGNHSSISSSKSEKVIKNSSGLEDTVSLSKASKDKASKSKFPFMAQKFSINKNQDGLTREQVADLQQLKSRDTEVRTHEQAHLSAAGQYARGGASFTYQKGPDGGSYAVGGEVGIDVAVESTPEATIAKMQTIKKAALAPADPSNADKRIAEQANIKEAQARQELLQVEQEELIRGESSTNSIAEDQIGHNNSNNPELITSTYSSLKSKIAAYVKMSAI